MNNFHLYFDDSGSRDPDKAFLSYGEREDGMDCFSLGGVLIAEEDIAAVLTAHKAFCKEHSIDYPLHSWAIRGGRGRFGWLKKPEKAGIFFSALDEHLLSLPIITLACVVHRPGYVARYKEIYQERLWLMCQTAFCILAERAAKFVDERGRRLKIYFEESGKKEDRDIISYVRMLRNDGPPFSAATSGGYTPLTAKDFQRILWGKPERKTKNTPMMQIADLVLYPMAKAGYEPNYPPFLKLQKAGKLINCHLATDDIPLRGIKYSCFDQETA